MIEGFEEILYQVLTHIASEPRTTVENLALIERWWRGLLAEVLRCLIREMLARARLVQALRVLVDDMCSRKYARRAWELANLGASLEAMKYVLRILSSRDQGEEIQRSIRVVHQVERALRQESAFEIDERRDLKYLPCCEALIVV